MHGRDRKIVHAPAAGAAARLDDFYVLPRGGSKLPTSICALSGRLVSQSLRRYDLDLVGSRRRLATAAQPVWALSCRAAAVAEIRSCRTGVHVIDAAAAERKTTWPNRKLPLPC
jgi:hypothetical protein